MILIEQLGVWPWKSEAVLRHRDIFLGGKDNFGLGCLPNCENQELFHPLLIPKLKTYEILDNFEPRKWLGILVQIEFPAYSFFLYYDKKIS